MLHAYFFIHFCGINIPLFPTRKPKIDLCECNRQQLLGSLPMSITGMSMSMSVPIWTVCVCVCACRMCLCPCLYVSNTAACATWSSNPPPPLLPLPQKPFHSSWIPEDLRPRSGLFHVFTHHTRLNVAETRRVMYPDAAWVTILRDPVTQFESAYDYAGFRHFWKLSLEEFIALPLQKKRSLPRIGGK